MQRYKLIETEAGRALHVDEFEAPSDTEALRRTHEVVEADFELFRGDKLIASRESPGPAFAIAV